MSIEIRALELQLTSMESKIKSLENRVLDNKAELLNDKYKGKLVVIDQEDFSRDSVIVKNPNFRVIEGELILKPLRDSRGNSEDIPTLIPRVKKFYGSLKVDISSIREVDATTLEAILKRIQAQKEIKEDKYKEDMGTLKGLLADMNNIKATPWTESIEDTEEDNEKAEESFKQAEPELVSDSTDKVEKVKMHQELVIKAGEKIKEIKDSLS